MKVLHILTGGKTGGIETLCRELGQNSRHDNAFCFMTFGGDVYEQMDMLGIKTYPFFAISKSKFSVKKLIRLVRLATQYDVIVVHHADPFVEMMYILAKLFTRKKGVRYIHSCYGDKTQIHGGIIKRNVERIIRQLSISISDRVIVVSKAGISSCKERFSLNDSKTKLIYNGISKSYLNDKIIRNDHNDRPSILYVGRLEKIKGVDMLIDAFSLLADKYKIRLSIVGDGSEREHLEELVKEKNIENDVTFYGSQVNIKPYLEASDIFVYPSICQEVFGISIVEAMAYGLVCVANSVGGIPEIIVDSQNGFMTDKPDTESLAKAIEKAIFVLDNDDIFNSIQEKAIETANRFSVENTCKQFDEIVGCY